MNFSDFTGKKLSPEESSAINFLRLLCIVSVVMIHSHTLQFASSPEAYSIIQQFNNLFTVFPALPLLFIVSGYLFFHAVDREKNFFPAYRAKLKKRVGSLLVPYLIWNSVGMVIGYFRHDPDLNLESVGGFLQAYWPLDPMGHPIGRAIWFIRNLIFFSLLSPVYFLLIKYLKHATLLLVAVLLFVEIPVDYLYFNVFLLIGSYLGLYKFSVRQLVARVPLNMAAVWYLPLLLVRSFVGLGAWFENLFALYAFFFFAACCLRVRNRFWGGLSSFSMFVYVSHLYISYSVTTVVLFVLPATLPGLLAAMPLSCVLTVSICAGVYVLFNRFCPRFLSFLIGGR